MRRSSRSSYKQLQEKRAVDASARFVCALTFADANGILFETDGREGRIAREPTGSGGFGYGPIFFYPPFGQTPAEAADRKASVSHRGAAFRTVDGIFGTVRLTLAAWDSRRTRD